MVATESAPGLSFPRDTFAQLTPKPFLLAHLQQPEPVRPSGRRPHEFRKPTINTGSLTHSNGSAVVRVGDTAVVCGVRGEILLASDIPHPPRDDAKESDLVENLGLLVPNVELSTGCSPAHLPGSPPSSTAQALSYRISSLLNDSGMVDLESLRIKYTLPRTEDDLPDEEPKIVTKAYWVLYVDILCLALDGNALDAAWLAVVAALRDTTLPRAWWDQDKESILCSPLTSEASKLNLANIPLAVTFAILSTASPYKQTQDTRTWTIADPDALEEDVCGESLTVVLTTSGEPGRSISRITRSGGCLPNAQLMRRCIGEAEKRCGELETVLRGY